MQTTEKGLLYPLKDIWMDIAESHKIPLRYFTEEYFLSEAEKESFPLLVDLSVHFAHTLRGIRIAEDNMTAFEGSNNISLAYFGRESLKHSNRIIEQGLIYINGRRIHIHLNENRLGGIKIRDKLIREASYRIGEDSFGSNFDKHSEGEYGFSQRLEDPNLPGVRDFLNHLLSRI